MYGFTVTDMNLKDYFGLKVQSSRKISVEVLSKFCDITLPDLTMYQNRERSTVSLEAISTSGISHCHWLLTVLKIIVQHTFLKIKNCGEFNQNAIVARSPKYIIGNIDIENLTLHITGKMIDDIFETGTCELEQMN